MKIIQIKNKPLRAFVSTLTLLSMIAAGAGIITYGLYGIGMVSPLTGLAGADTTELGIVWLLGFLTLLAVAVAGLIIWGLYVAARALYRRRSSRTLGSVVAWIAGIAAFVFAMYGIGLISPLSKMRPLQESGIIGIWAGGYFTFVGALVAVVLIYFLYAGVKKLYDGPFDP